MIDFFNSNIGFATILAGVLTAISTFIAVFVTSWQDRKERKYESNRQLYREKLLELHSVLNELKSINNFYFGKEKPACYTIIPEHQFPYKKQIQKITKIFQFISIIRPLSIFAKFYTTQIKSFLALDSFLSNIYNANIVEIPCNELMSKMKEYINNTNKNKNTSEFSNIDYSDKIEIIEEMEKEIQKEFKIG